MAVDLRVDQAVFEQQMNALNGCNLQMQESYLSIYREVGKLRGQAWSGSACELYHDKFEELFQHLEQIETVMDNVLTRLKTVLNIVTTTESNIVGKLNSVDEGTEYNSILGDN